MNEPLSSHLSSHEFTIERTSANGGGHTTSSGQQIWTLSDTPGHSRNTPKVPGSRPGRPTVRRTFTLATPNGRSTPKKFRRFGNSDRHIARPDVGQNESNASQQALFLGLLGPTGLAYRLNRPAIVGWSAGLAVLGLIGGLVAPYVAKAISDSAAIQRVIGLLGVRSGSAECLGIIFLVGAALVRLPSPPGSPTGGCCMPRFCIRAGRSPQPRSIGPPPLCRSAWASSAPWPRSCSSAGATLPAHDRPRMLRLNHTRARRKSCACATSGVGSPY